MTSVFVCLGFKIQDKSKILNNNLFLFMLESRTTDESVRVFEYKGPGNDDTSRRNSFSLERICD